MSHALVTCIIPVYNGERYLAETLRSVLAQSHPMHEVLVIDDGSTDGSAAIARSFEGVTLLQQANAGHAAARGLGLRHATGEFLSFLDADDLWAPDKTALQLSRFAARPELGVVFSHIRNFWSPDADPAQKPGPEAYVPIAGYTSVTMLARRSAFDEVGPFDVTLKHGNDRDWFCRAAERSIPMEMMPDVLVERRLHATNRSAAHGDASRAEYLRILKASLDRRRGAGAGEVTEYPFGTPPSNSR